jgi:hypothetical protein
MCALPPKADINGRIFDVRFAPQGDIWAAANRSFDYLIGAREHAGRNFKSESLRRSKVDYQLILGWKLHRQICRFLSFENAIDVTRCLVIGLDVVDAVVVRRLVGCPILREPSI